MATLSRRIRNPLTKLDICGQSGSSAHPIQNEGFEVTREDAPLVSEACSRQVSGLDPTAHGFVGNPACLCDIDNVQHRLGLLVGLTRHLHPLRQEEDADAPRPLEEWPLTPHGPRHAPTTEPARAASHLRALRSVAVKRPGASATPCRCSSWRRSIDWSSRDQGSTIFRF